MIYSHLTYENGGLGIENFCLIELTAICRAQIFGNLGTTVPSPDMADLADFEIPTGLLLVQTHFLILKHFAHNCTEVAEIYSFKKKLQR